MNPEFINILKQLISEQGKEAFLNYAKCRAFLADYARGEHKKESRLLLQALEAGVQKAIDAAGELDICKKQQIRVLREERFLTEEAAAEIVDALALVLRGAENKTAQNTVCAKCGKELQKEWKTCPYCSAPAGGQAKSAVSSGAGSGGQAVLPSGFKLIRTFDNNACVFSIAFSPDGKYIVSGSNDNTVKLWETESGRLTRNFEDEEEEDDDDDDAVSPVAFNPDGKYIVSGSSNNTVKLWRTKTGKLIRTFEDHDDDVNSVAFSHDGKYIVSGSDDNTVKLWETESGRLIRTFEDEEEEEDDDDDDEYAVLSVAFSPDGKYIVSGPCNNTVKLWETESGQLECIFGKHEYRVWSVAFSPDGKYIVSGSTDSTIKLWEAESGLLIRTLKGHKDYVNSVAFSPDGKYIVSGGSDKTIKLWETENGLLIHTLKGHKYAVNSVSFSPDGKYIASGSVDSTIKLWGLE